MMYGNNGYPIYGNYPQPFQNAQPTQTNAAIAQQGNGGMIWVQGESGAKSYLVAAGCSVLLMDSESQRFFIKSVDESGIPKPLRIFEYTEIIQNSTQEQSCEQYATKDELTEQIRILKSEIDKLSNFLSEQKGEE